MFKNWKLKPLFFCIFPCESVLMYLFILIYSYPDRIFHFLFSFVLLQLLTLFKPHLLASSWNSLLWCLLWHCFVLDLLLFPFSFFLFLLFLNWPVYFIFFNLAITQASAFFSSSTLLASLFTSNCFPRSRSTFLTAVEHLYHAHQKQTPKSNSWSSSAQIQDPKLLPELLPSISSPVSL